MERSKAIFIVRTLEPVKNITKTKKKNISREFLIQSDVLEFERSHQLDLQHLEYADQRKKELKRKKKATYIKYKKQKNKDI